MKILHQGCGKFILVQRNKGQSLLIDSKQARTAKAVNIYFLHTNKNTFDARRKKVFSYLYFIISRKWNFPTYICEFCKEII